MRRVVRCFLERLDDDPLDIVIGDLARPTRTRVVVQPVEAVLDEPGPPFRDRGAGDFEPLGDLGVGTAFGAGQHDPAS